MDFRERLQAILSRQATRPESSDPVRVEPPLEELVPGRWLAVGPSRCFVSQHTYELAYRHGAHRLAEALGVPTRVWEPFVAGAGGAPFDLEQAVFIDTETTGLGRGTGTYCFLIGLGSLEGDRFSVRQYFMPDFGEEEALLELVAQDIQGRAGLVSFNGRSFDWPLMEMRYLLARRPAPHRGEPHLDLLHASRRLWRRTLSSCALSALEDQLLGVQRAEIDVPGYLIPQLYLDYVERARTRPMAHVFYHNAVDVLSMMALAAHIGAAVSQPFEGRQDKDYVSLGRLYAQRGEYPLAEQAFRAAATGSAGDITLARRELSLLLKRQGRWQEAMDIWWGELEGHELYPYVELAKQLEHRLADYQSARGVVARAITRVQSGRIACDDPNIMLAELTHRLARLDARLTKKAGEVPRDEP